MALVAFAIIYFVWGSTFLAIRVGVAGIGLQKIKSIPGFSAAS